MSRKDSSLSLSPRGPSLILSSWGIFQSRLWTSSCHCPCSKTSAQSSKDPTEDRHNQVTPTSWREGLHDLAQAIECQRTELLPSAERTEQLKYHLGTTRLVPNDRCPLKVHSSRAAIPILHETQQTCAANYEIFSGWFSSQKTITYASILHESFP